MLQTFICRRQVCALEQGNKAWEQGNKAATLEQGNKAWEQGNKAAANLEQKLGSRGKKMRVLQPDFGKLEHEIVGQFRP